MNNQRSIIDDHLRAEIEDELKWDPAVPSTNIGVSVTDHAITLSGTVHSLVEQLSTVKAARRVNGVHAIVDEIVVQPVGPEDTSDVAISTRIERRLETSSAIPAGVTATVRDGNVTLNGVVEWKYQSRVAERVVHDVIGVRHVQNDIVVKPGAETRIVRNHIVAALHRNAALDANQIHVVTEGGTVWLSGNVNSWNAKRQAESAAWSSPGVTAVRDTITVH